MREAPGLVRARPNSARAPNPALVSRIRYSVRAPASVRAITSRWISFVPS